jgi:glycosyltransferase involved in cell wall biosynthesis
MLERIKELNIEKSFLLVTDDMEFWPILQRSNLFIRPTSTDSFGISIAEALTLGVPSIASNVCGRPEGTILFKSRDQEDLYKKVRQVIADYESYRSRVQNWQYENCAPIIQGIYEELIGE